MVESGGSRPFIIVNFLEEALRTSVQLRAPPQKMKDKILDKIKKAISKDTPLSPGGVSIKDEETKEWFRYFISKMDELESRIKELENK